MKHDTPAFTVPYLSESRYLSNVHVRNVKHFQDEIESGPGSGPHAGGGKIVHEGHDAILKEAGYTQTDKKGQYKDADGNKVQVSKNGAFTATSKTYQMKVGTTADDLKSAISKRFAAALEAVKVTGVL